MSKHLLIAGTGRAGTSLLVRYLNELGMETHLSSHNENSWWNDDANAGLEDHLLKGSNDLPYVIKTPWLYEYIDQVLARSELKIDGVILPIRNLIEAASSRVILERQQVHRRLPWMADEAQSWDTHGTTPGGIIYSLSPVDQARLLAVGFHHLVERVLVADIPLYLLAFPRFTTDPDYLFDSLRPCLPASANRETSAAAHQRVVDASKVRVGEELGERESAKSTTDSEEFPSSVVLDNAALRREITSLRRSLAVAQDALASAQNELNSTTERVAKESDSPSSLRQQAVEYQKRIAMLEQNLTAIRSSTSWRVTGVLRSVSRLTRSVVGS